MADPTPDARLAERLAEIAAEWGDAVAAISGCPGAPPAEAIDRLVIDPEGEYHTLRERFDYILAAPAGGDTVAHPRTAKLLAERLLQLGVSAILDIYELNPDDRALFVQRFLDALVNAPRDLWHPALVVLDEAHVYAPEGKENASTAAVKALASRGRKRGFALVPATQRLAKLSKDVAAECNNKLIGRCTLDVDIKRAAEELGFTTAEQRQALRHLEPGQFYAFGPAFDLKAPALVHVGPVTTTHAEAGQKAAPTPPATEKVRKVLAQLADLPAEAEQRERTVAELRQDLAAKDRRIKELERGASGSGSPVQTPKTVDILTDADRAKLGDLAAALRKYDEFIGGAVERIGALLQERVASAVASALAEARANVDRMAADAERRLHAVSVTRVLEKLDRVTAPPPATPLAAGRPLVTTIDPNGGRTAPSGLARVTRDERFAAPEGVTPARQKILNALAFFAGIGVAAVDKTQLALLTGVPPTSGGYKNNLGALRSADLVTYPQPGTVALTPLGTRAAGTDGVPTSVPALHAAIRDRLRRRAGSFSSC